MKYSLWIVPPDPHFSEIHSKIRYLAKLNDTPSFIPHITLTSGIKINEEVDHKRGVSALLDELKKEFESFRGDDAGGIPCQFNRSRGFVTGYSKDNKNEIVWSQACVGIIERNEKLIEALKQAEKCLRNSKYVAKRAKITSASTLDFSLPLQEPHLSFVYKTSTVQLRGENEEERLELPQDFIANEIVLAKTEPSSFAGVSLWQNVGSFLI